MEYEILLNVFGNEGTVRAEEVTGEQSSRRFVTQDGGDLSTCAKRGLEKIVLKIPSNALCFGSPDAAAAQRTGPLLLGTSSAT